MHPLSRVVRLRLGLPLLAVIMIAMSPERADAYIGPGAGFAVGGSFLAVFAAMFSAFLMIISWPIRLVWRALFRRRPPRPPQFQRVVVLGLDGLDFGLTQKMLGEGKLPNLARLQKQGCFMPLGSTLPPISPVAWSTFQTGTNPGKHNIFDFLFPDEQTYQPKPSSVEVRPPRRSIRFGKYTFPLSKPDVRLLRKSKPFWSVLSDYGIFNCILRVPITFPPEKLRGVQLSAMCVPDIRGTQGTFSLFTTLPKDEGKKTGGEIQVVRRQGKSIQGDLLGPDHPLNKDLGPLKAPFTITIRDASGGARLRVDGKDHDLKVGVYTEWVTVRYKIMPGMSVTGVCRFLLLSTEPHFELYATPVNIDPENPALPIGYPAVYPVYLANRHGPYATLGLAEDTGGLNEHVLDDEHFRRQCMDIDAEREAMFLDSLDKVKRGLCVCVFDSPDRMQHMFWRYHDEQHPARPAQVPDDFKNAVEDLYRRMDNLVGKTMNECTGNDNLLMVLSDHGFNTFRRGIDLNRWLEENGYLVVEDARRGEEYLAGVDWSKTRAFAIGLTGIFINRKDKFARGIVPAADMDALRQEIVQKLSALIDPETGASAIRRVYQAEKAYIGPYKGNAPDLIVGYAGSYRVSWDAAVGKTTTAIFHSNTKAWSGDHCVDPSVVPGVLFCNQPIQADHPRLLDIAPTILNLFGIPVPSYMDGKPLLVGQQPAAASGSNEAIMDLSRGKARAPGKNEV